MTCDVSELIRAANEISKLSPSETDRLLQRAAATIRDYREQIAYSERILTIRARATLSSN